MGSCNLPPCLRNRLLTKLVFSELGVLGVLYTVPVDLEELNAGYRWILESRIDKQGGEEVSPLLVEIMLKIILCSYHLHGFLCSADITQESISGDRREICHRLCG